MERTFCKIANVNATQILKKFCNHGDLIGQKTNGGSSSIYRCSCSFKRLISSLVMTNLDSKLFDLLKTTTTDENKKIKDAIR